MSDKTVRNTDRIGCSASALQNKRLHMGRKSEEDDELYLEHEDDEVNACLNCKQSQKYCNGNCDIIKRIRNERLKQGGKGV